MNEGTVTDQMMMVVRGVDDYSEEVERAPSSPMAYELTIERFFL